MLKAPQRRVKAFTLVELAVVLVAILIVASLLLVAVQSQRETSRRTDCSSNLVQIGTAIQNYHTLHKNLPIHGIGPTNEFEDNWAVADNPGPADGPAVGYTRNMLSLHVALLSLLDQNPLYEEIAYPHTDANGQSWPEMGPAPYSARFKPWATEVPVFRCPSDPGFGLPALGRTNFAACTGDAPARSSVGGARFDAEKGRWVYWGDSWLVQQVNTAQRGVFVPRKTMRLNDILDGLSATVMIGEIATDLGDGAISTSPALFNGGHGNDWGNGIMLNPSTCRDNFSVDPDRPRFWAPTAQQSGAATKRGFRWADYRPVFTQMNTILPPNSELCNGGGHASDSIAPASSRHGGGASVLMADGSVRFVSETIDSGDARAETVWSRSAATESSNPRGSKSPYGVWGAMGTRAAED